MTVRELIERLQRYDPDETVYMEADAGYADVGGVEKSHSVLFLYQDMGEFEVTDLNRDPSRRLFSAEDEDEADG